MDPEIVKKYDLDKQEGSGFTGRKLYAEEDLTSANDSESAESQQKADKISNH